MKCANFFVLFYNVHKENMFTIEKEDECEAPLKPIIIYVASMSDSVYSLQVYTSKWLNLFGPTYQWPRYGLWFKKRGIKCSGILINYRLWENACIDRQVASSKFNNSNAHKFLKGAVTLSRHIIIPFI